MVVFDHKDAGQVPQGSHVEGLKHLALQARQARGQEAAAPQQLGGSQADAACTLVQSAQWRAAHTGRQKATGPCLAGRRTWLAAPSPYIVTATPPSPAYWWARARPAPSGTCAPTMPWPPKKLACRRYMCMLPPLPCTCRQGAGRQGAGRPHQQLHLAGREALLAGTVPLRWPGTTLDLAAEQQVLALRRARRPDPKDSRTRAGPPWRRPLPCPSARQTLFQHAQPIHRW